MLVERNPNGSIAISALIGDTLETRQYYFMSEDEAVAEFNAEFGQDILDAMAEKLNELAESRAEYETRHKDSGANYAALVSEGSTDDRQARLVEFMSEKGIDWAGVDIDAIDERVLDEFVMTPAYVFACGRADHCLLDSFAVGEIEFQIDAAEIGADEFTPDLCEKLTRESDVFLRYQDSQTALGYQGIDSIWDAEISEDALRAIVAELKGESCD